MEDHKSRALNNVKLPFGTTDTLDQHVASRYKDLLYNCWFYFFLSCYFLYSIFTTSVQNMPWYDEVWFASITESVLTNGTFHLNISPLYGHEMEYLFYGPVYFLLTSISVDIFGWGLWQFRLINILGAIGCIYILYLMLRGASLSKSVTGIVLLLFATDNMFIFNVHSGRMDALALLFILSGTYFVLRSKEDKVSDVVLAGVFAALAVLTTPRSTFFLVPLVLISVSRIYRRWSLSQLRSYGLALVVFCGINLIWVFIKFGSIGSYLEYLTVFQFNVDGEKAIEMDYFLGGNFKLQKYHMPILLLFCASYLWLLVKKERITELMIVNLVNVLIYFLVIRDTGAYSTYMLPFLYLQVFWVLHHTVANLRINKYVITLLILVNIGYFSMRNLKIFNSLSMRDHSQVTAFMQDHIPETSRVIGFDRYYFAALQSKIAYQSIERGASVHDRIQYHLNTFDAQYLLISHQAKEYGDEELVEHYLNTGAFEEVARFSDRGTLPGTVLQMPSMLNAEVFDYSATLYRRIR